MNKNFHIYLSRFLLLLLCACQSTSETRGVQLTKALSWTWTFSEKHTVEKVESFRDYAKKMYIYNWDSENDYKFEESVLNSPLFKNGKLITQTSLSCDNKLEKAKINVEARLKNLKLFSYQLVYNTATGTRLHPTYNIVLEEQPSTQPNRSQFNYIHTMTWNYGSAETKLKGFGVGKATVIVDYSCSDNSAAKANINITDVTTSNPIVDLGFKQNMANLFLSPKLKDNSHQFLSSNTFVVDNKTQIRQLLQQVVGIQNERYSFGNKQLIEISSWNHPVSFQLALSRIQRKRTKLRFNDKTNSFRFEDTIKINGAEVIVHSIFNLFPEKNNSVQIVGSIKFKTITDNFLGNIIFSEEDAKLLAKKNHKWIKNALKGG